jgi:hypothetical protein
MKFIFPHCINLVLCYLLVGAAGGILDLRGMINTELVDLPYDHEDLTNISVHNQHCTSCEFLMKNFEISETNSR